MTPVSRWLGSREAKRIVGEVDLQVDGSALFDVPARKPLYLQLIDTGGCMVNSQRSWFMVQPGERFSCYGCHEDKNEGTGQGHVPLAIHAVLPDSFYDISNDYLYYPKYIQPILNEKCITCHNENHEKGLDLRGDSIWTGDLTDPDNKDAGRYWCRSYINLTDPEKHYVDYIPSNSPTAGMAPYSNGSSKSALITRLKSGHSDLTFSDGQIEKLCAWIDLGIPHSGAYSDDMKPEHAAKYLERLARRTKHEQLEAENIAAFVAAGGFNIGIIDRHHGHRSVGRTSDCRITVRFFRTARQLSVSVPSEGMLSLINLHGRKICTVAISLQQYLSEGAVSIPTPVPPGIYIVNFSGRKGVARSLISML